MNFGDFLALDGLKEEKFGLGVEETARNAMLEEAQARCGYRWRSLSPHKAGRIFSSGSQNLQNCMYFGHSACGWALVFTGFVIDLLNSGPL